MMNGLDLVAIHEDLAFTKSQGKLFKDTEEERLLFAKDPYVYFYEDFLKAYDKETRKGRGVYYTPPPVVNFIIRAVNDILKETFGIKAGLADRKKVTVLDFATGTGTFLIEVLQQIFETTSKGTRDLVIKEHVLKNLYGFEYLIAPYTIAHLKLSQFLHDKGYDMQRDERLQIYLTNTLEPIEPQANFLLPALTREVESAQEVKDKPILVITGNPPYSGHSKNKGEWISGLIDTYKTVDGRPLGEKNPKWLQDDYVKFIRFAQWKMQQVEEGIVGIITNHSFLDNPTFRGMRQSLMETFNQIYILDLHGNTKKKETTPEGGKDENVFDIEQGVAISLLVRKEGLERGVFHADLYGQRKPKYRQLLESDFSNVEWQKLNPITPYYLFIPQDTELLGEYEQGWKVTEIFGVNSVGIATGSDKLFIGFDESDSKQRFLSKHSDYQKELVKRFAYRPFDYRQLYFDVNLLERARQKLMYHMLFENIGLCTSRGIETKRGWEHVLCADALTNLHNVSMKEGNYLFPLYLYPPPEEEKQPKASLFEEDDPFETEGDPAHGNRIPNFSLEFRNFIDEKYGKPYTPEQILGYIYAVLHSPAYRSKYLEFLKIDFPRIPFVEDTATFETLSILGWDLVKAHLLRTIPDTPKIDVSNGSLEVEKPVYVEKEEKLYINKERYFSPVPKEVWEFHIGGYQVLDKYLKSRKGRDLSLDEIENIQNIIKTLAFTLERMQKIDEAWQV